MSEDQCGLCLSCAAPFAFHSQDVSFYDRPGNLSILYLNEKCRHNPVLMERFKDPKLVDVNEKSHVFHESHHGAAIHYMTHHHTGDGAPSLGLVGVGRTKLPTPNGPMPFFTGARASTGPSVAVWTRPDEAQRVDLAPLLSFLVDHRALRPRVMRQNLDLTFQICKGCNSLMTNLAMVGFLVGMGVNARKNAQSPLIHVGDTPIKVRTADAKNVIDLKKAFGVWSYASAGPGEPLPDLTKEDPVAPSVGYYLHCCLPFMAAGAASPFAPGGSPELIQAVRLQYVELSWVLLMITCTLTLIEQGKPYGDKPTGGMQQHYGVLDVYVSYFIWRLMKYEFGASNARSPDFVQWHQKYFWDAMRMPVFDGRRSQAGLGVEMLPTSQVAAQELFGLVCTALMDLYEVKLRPLVRFVARQDFGVPRTPDEDFTSNYFVPPGALRALIRMRNAGKHADFDETLSNFGINALLFRMIQLSSDEMRPLLKDFRRSWQFLEIDRIRSKTPGLTMLSAHTIYTLCNLLKPPDELPHEKAAAAEVLAGDVCSPWTAVIALRSLGAFRDTK